MVMGNHMVMENPRKSHNLSSISQGIQKASGIIQFKSKVLRIKEGRGVKSV